MFTPNHERYFLARHFSIPNNPFRHFLTAITKALRPHFNKPLHFGNHCHFLQWQLVALWSGPTRKAATAAAANPLPRQSADVRPAQFLLVARWSGPTRKIAAAATASPPATPSTQQRCARTTPTHPPIRSLKATRSPSPSPRTTPRLPTCAQRYASRP